MPRHYKKKRSPRVKRKLIRRGRQSIPRGLSPAVFHFKRKRHHILSLGTSGEGWLINSDSTGMYKSFDFRLDDLSDNSDFVNLFRFYKINAVAVKIWPCNTYTGENTYTGQFSNSQILVRWDINNDGIGGATVGSQAHYQCSQTAKSKRLISGQANPLTLYMKLKQSNMVYKAASLEPSLSNTAYTLQRPKWTSTTDLGVAHYGLNIMMHRMSDDTLSQGFNNQQKLRIEYTYYISCKKVQ